MLSYNAPRSRYEWSGYEGYLHAKSAGFRYAPDLRVWHTTDSAKARACAEAAGESCVSETAAAALNRMADRARESHALDPPDEAVELRMPSTERLMPFQEAGVRWLLRTPFALLADDMGLGKTCQALCACNALPTGARVLIVCPASLRINWMREAERWLEPPRKIAIAKAGKPLPDADVVIVNYDVLHRWDWALQGRWDVVILDESHYIKSPKARRTKAAMALQRMADRIICMSGTPMLSRPAELWTTLHLLRPDLWPKKQLWTYYGKYCDLKQTYGHWDFSGCSNAAELGRQLREQLMLRRTKAEVLTELPPKIRQIVCLPPTPDQARIIAAEKAAFGAQLEEWGLPSNEVGYNTCLERLRFGQSLVLSQISQLRHALALTKVESCIEYITTILQETGESVVCFGHHRDMLEQLSQALPQAVLAYGGQTPAERQFAVDSFQQGHARVFVGSLQACGVGLTLTAARHVVFAELDWNPSTVDQAESRCHRITQTGTVHVHHLVVDGSLDAHMCKLIVAKQRDVDSIMKG